MVRDDDAVETEFFGAHRVLHQLAGRELLR
jgi:hypothetical protein